MSRALWHRFRRWWTADRIRVPRRPETAPPGIGDRLQWGRRVFRVVAADGRRLCLQAADAEPFGTAGPCELRVEGESWMLLEAGAPPVVLSPLDTILYRHEPRSSDAGLSPNRGRRRAGTR